MPYSVLSAFFKPARRGAPCSRNRIRFESLEPRRNLSGIVGAVHLVNDTGASNSDKITSVGTITGYANVPVSVTDNVGNVTGEITQTGTFTYDPVAVDSALASYDGTVQLQFESVSGPVHVIDFSFVLDNVAPTVNGISDVTVNENAAPTSIDLTSAFSSASTPGSQMQFQVTAVSNSSLVTSTSISSGGALTLNYASWQYGAAAITVQATDLAGNTSSTTFNVNVVQIPPVLSNFIVSQTASDIWTFTGNVGDSNPAACYIVFGGVADGVPEVGVNSDGSFSETVVIDDLPPGIVTAQAIDPQGLVSNTAGYDIS